MKYSFTEFRKFVEYEILPLIEYLSVETTRNIRNKISYALDYQNLIYNIDGINERYDLEISIEILQQKFFKYYGIQQ